MKKKVPPPELPMYPGEEFIGDYWEAVGCSWRGNQTKRDGKRVSCGHKHRSEQAAEKCVQKMKKTRPGNCQTYRANHYYLVMRRKKK